jgi:hypothetical protein
MKNRRAPRGLRLLLDTTKFAGDISPHEYIRRLSAIAGNRRLNPDVRSQAAGFAGRMTAQLLLKGDARVVRGLRNR